jgi:hypothetical protein
MYDTCFVKLERELHTVGAMLYTQHFLGFAQGSLWRQGFQPLLPTLLHEHYKYVLDN